MSGATPRTDSRRIHAARTRRRAALREAAYLAALLTTAAATYAVLILYPSRLKTRQLRAQLEQQRQQVEVLEESIANLRRDAQALHDDPWSIERALRARLGYLRQGERVFRGGG